MSHNLSSLSEADIRQLTQLIDSLERSAFDFLQVQVGDLKVTIGKGDPTLAASAPLPAPPAAPFADTPRAAPAAPPKAAAAPAPVPAAKPAPAAAAEAGTVDITSPLLGVFYAQPEPGAPPFVTVGAEVNEDTTVALVEVMKTFNAVPAGLRGTIIEVCAQNAQLVEFGQVLFRVRPA